MMEGKAMKVITLIIAFTVGFLLCDFVDGYTCNKNGYVLSVFYGKYECLEKVEK